jgi:arylsulfatase A
MCDQHSSTLGKRRRRCEWFIAIGICGLLGAGAGNVAEPAQPPNIVILYADDMGPGDIAAANADAKIPTPHLDRLCREGTRFTDAHSSSGICTPSRYALLQGRYHWRKFHGIVQAFGQPVLDADRTTLAELLKSRGYRTACIGKWHLGWDWAAIRRPGIEARPEGGRRPHAPGDFDWSRPIPGGPLAHGFDHYFGDDVPNFPPYAWIRGDRIVVPPTVDLQTPDMPAEGNWEARPGPSVAGWNFHAVMPRLTAEAEAWIDEQKPDTPFLLYMPFTSPHAPIVPTEEFRGRSQAGGYGDFVVQTDATVGRVLAALDAKGISDNTIVIFSADNGPEAYAYERVRAFGHRSTGPLRGVKRDLWEGGHRVPLLVRWPGHVPAGRVETGLVGQIDLYATLAGIVGAEIPSGSAEDSLDQRPLLTGTGPSRRDTLIHNTAARTYAIRHGDWVLIDARSGGQSRVPDWFNEAEGFAKNDAPGELYDLRSDPGQRRNLHAAEPQRVADLKRRLDALVGDRRQPEPP